MLSCLGLLACWSSQSSLRSLHFSPLTLILHRPSPPSHAPLAWASSPCSPSSVHFSPFPLPEAMDSSSRPRIQWVADSLDPTAPPAPTKKTDPDKRDPAVPTDCKTCSVCKAVLGKEMFSAKGSQCKDCDNSTESLQRLMRTKWAGQYKKNTRSCARTSRSGTAS